MDEAIKQIGERLKGLREVLNIPAEEIAELCEISLDHYLKIESGEADPSVYRLSKISKRYGIDLDVLLFGEEPRMKGYYVTRKGHKKMKEEKKKIQNNFIVAAGLLALFILYTVAIMFVDVQPIGPQGSSVGFAEVNQYFHTLFGVNMLLYSITDWLSIAVLFIMFGFAMVGLVQLIKRKSLFRVDSSILVLGGFYVLVFLAYLFFEFFVVNYRPVLIEGVLEASYPSSTTMLMMCIMPTAIMQFHHLISSKRLRNIVNAFCGIYASFMVIGRVLSGVHWFTDIVGGILLSATLVMLYYSTNQLVNSKASRSSQRSR